MGLAPQLPAIHELSCGRICSSSGHRYTCRQIGSFAHAQDLLRQGHTHLARNGEGTA